jgi:hypothetical protein
MLLVKVPLTRINIASFSSSRRMSQCAVHRVIISDPSPIQHAFSVVRSANSTKYNFANPVRRDTVNTGLEGSNATIRFVTDNSGPWFLHWYVTLLILK